MMSNFGSFVRKKPHINLVSGGELDALLECFMPCHSPLSIAQTLQKGLCFHSGLMSEASSDMAILVTNLAPL